ncbi:MAG: zinc ribbon domain-containing protein [Minisyncoccales bacterium]
MGRKEFIFSGLLKCARCGRSMSADLKKGKYIYYSCSNGKKNCKREYVREEVLLEPIKRFLRKIKLDDEQIVQLVTYLKKNHENQALYHTRKIKEIDQKYSKIQNRISRSFDLLADGSITKDIYDAKLKEYKEQQYDLGIQKDELTQADENYHIVAKTVLNIAQKAEEIFESSEVAEKNQFMKFLLQNSVVDGKKPVFTMREPFSCIAKASNHPTLLRG